MDFKKPYVSKNYLFLIAALLVALFITWKIIEQAAQTHRLQQQLEEINTEIELLNQLKKNQALNNEFLESDYYLDLSIREQQGRGLPGEKLLILDQDRIASLKEAYRPPEVETVEEPVSASNLEQWWHFLSNQPPPGP